MRIPWVHGRSSRLRCQEAAPVDVHDPMRLAYEFHSREVTIDDTQLFPLHGYLTEEVRRSEDEPRTTRALLLIPDAAGWRHPPVRRLADRLAVFCSCLVLVPDLLRGSESWAPDAVRAGPDYSSWLSSVSPSSVASGVRESIVYLRADERASRLALLGSGFGGNLALEHAVLPDIYSAAVVRCRGIRTPPRHQLGGGGEVQRDSNAQPSDLEPGAQHHLS